MLGKITQGNAELVSDVADADVVVEAAKKESIETILEMADLKRRGAIKGVIVTGCLAQRYPEELRGELPEVDAIVGVTAEDEVPGLIERFGGGCCASEAPAASP